MDIVKQLVKQIAQLPSYFLYQVESSILHRVIIEADKEKADKWIEKSLHRWNFNGATQEEIQETEGYLLAI